MDSGGILTSIIGASVATISLAMGKDSKVSEFRQEWIDALREDVAKLCSVSMALYNGNVAYSSKERLKLEIPYGATNDLVQEANNVKFRIRLRLDSKKGHSIGLREALDYLTHCASIATEPMTRVDEAIEKVLLKTEVILDEAWIKVRRGERRFRWTYRFALTTLIVSIGLLASHWLLNGHKF